MAFKFKWFVQLLEHLEEPRKQRIVSIPAHKSEPHIVREWFKEHHSRIPRHGSSAVAFLSCIFPERLSQRTYANREGRLANVLSRICGFGSSRAQSLRSWKERNVDFAECFADLLAQTENHLTEGCNEVTLEEIDAALLQLAANSAFSSAEIRKSLSAKSAEDILRSIFLRLHSSEAKWLVRMILKSYCPVQIPEKTTLQCFHFLLPDILDVQNSFAEAVAILGKADIVRIPPDPPRDVRPQYREACARHLVPRLGVVIKLQAYAKARSIKSCCRMANRRIMCVERKYDGEYCQVHIDKSKGRDCVRIFSKSGKDSTEDRFRLHGALEAGLRLNQPDCAFNENCIVEGELLIWSRSKKTILPFHTIRKHVMHGRRIIGADADSPRTPDEQLMIVFYDILYLDNQILTDEPHKERRKHLERIIRPLEGEAQIADHQIIDFGSESAKAELHEFFAYAINRRWEGLVLKGYGDPYFSWDDNTRPIKLKKDYISGLGDVADLCIIGGLREQSVVDQLELGPLLWTSFHLACVENKEDVRRFGTRPCFRILDVLSHHNIPKETIQFLNQRGKFLQVPSEELSTEHLEVRIDQPQLELRRPTALFKDPFIVEVTGAGFERPQNVSYFVLRFPRNVKLHTDRNCMETNTFEELQEMAKKSLTPPGPEEQEDAHWIQRLICVDGNSASIDRHAQGTPSPSRSSITPPSPLSDSPRRNLKRKPHEPLLAEAAVKRSKPDAFKKPLRPGCLTSQVLVSEIQPFDPPAVFRSPGKRSSKNFETFPITNHRRPLSELTNASSHRASRTLRPPAPIQQLNHDGANDETPVKEQGGGKQPEPSGGKKSQPDVSILGPTFLDEVVLNVLGNSTCTAFRDANPIFIKLVDKAYPNSVAHTIREIAIHVLRAYRRLWTAGRNKLSDNNHQAMKSRRMVLFYDDEFRTYISDDRVPGTSGYDTLRRKETRTLFAGCLLFTAEDGQREMTWQAMFSWDNTVEMLKRLHSK